MKEQLEILYQDDVLVAINKPSGLLVHRTMIDRHETRFAVQLLRNQLKQRVYPVHRLDKPTSGVLLFALNRDIARQVGTSFSEQQIYKRYMAVVRGWPDDEGEIDYALTDGPDFGSQVDDAVARPAVTRYRTLARCEVPFAVGRYQQSRYALVEMTPLNGRRHQLRRHFKHIFHPLIGDTSYGEGRHNRLFREQFDCQRLLLHACELRLTHPLSGKELRLQTDVPENFAQVLQAAGLQPTVPRL